MLSKGGICIGNGIFGALSRMFCHISEMYDTRAGAADVA